MITTHFLMNPKTGGSTLARFSTCMNHCKTHENVKFITHFHTTLYTPTYYVTLRDPCERTLSAFHHLKNTYHNHGECKNGKCHKHIMYNISYSSYIQQLPVLKKIWRHKDTRSINRHMVVLAPQNLWVGNQSHIICTPRLSEMLASLQGKFCNCSSISNRQQYDKNASYLFCEQIYDTYYDDYVLYKTHCSSYV